MIPDRTLGYVLFLVFLEPLLHEGYGPVAASFVYLFYQIIEDGLVPFRVSFGTSAFARLEGGDTSCIVRPYPIPYCVRTYRKMPHDLRTCCTFSYVDNDPYACFLRFIVSMGKCVTKFRYTVAGAQGQCRFHTYSMRSVRGVTQGLVVDGIT